MGRRYGAGDMRRDYKAAASSATDRLWQDYSEPPCEQTAAEELAAEGLIGFDPECRFARDGFELGLHACTRRDGKLVEAGEPGQCFAEQRAQVLEQGKTLQAAESLPVFDALRQGLS